MKRNVVAFLNMKGGVCKTSLCKEIALYLAEEFQNKVEIEVKEKSRVLIN